MQKVNVIIKGIINLRLEQLNAFQEDIKTLTEARYQSLKEEIMEDGFAFSPHVWVDSNGEAWILDGHQRRTCLTRMKEEGFEIPLIPCMEVEASSLEHARRLVLAGTSQYGTFQIKKLEAFSLKTGLDPLALQKRFTLPLAPLAPKEPEEPSNSGNSALGNSIKQIVLYFPAEDYKRVVDLSGELCAKLNCDDNSQLFLRLMENAKA